MQKPTSKSDEASKVIALPVQVDHLAEAQKHLNAVYQRHGLESPAHLRETTESEAIRPERPGVVLQFRPRSDKNR